MRPDDVRLFVKRQPFQPFRVKISGGEVFEVSHPDMVIVGTATVAIGVPHPSHPGGAVDRIVTVSLSHVIELEPTPANV